MIESERVWHPRLFRPEAAVKQIEFDVNDLVTNDPSYEAIRIGGHQADVVQLITETYKQDGILLSVEEAAQQVEEYVTEQYLKLTSINKIKSKLTQSDATKATSTPEKTDSGQQPGQTQSLKTLTNSVGSSRQLTARERAELAFKGQLK